MKNIYGYCRISTNKQNIERQVRNIISAFPEAKIIKETYTGTKFQGRKELNKLLKSLTSGDTLIFDSVSRMSRNADEGFQLYEQLYYKNINLVFLKEPYINTETYKQGLDKQLKMTGDIVDAILKGINEYMMLLAKQQIKLAFEQSEKEVHDLRQRTKEGIETARRNGKQIGQNKGNTLNVKKEKPSKTIILKHNKSFGGNLSDTETMRLAEISRNTFYKYKKQLISEAENSSIEVIFDKYLNN